MNKSELRKVLEIAIPACVSWAGHVAYNVTDNLMVARILGSEMLAVSGIASSIYYIFLLLGMGSTGIILALISESLATGTSTSKIMQNCIIFCLLMGFIIAFPLYFFTADLVGMVSKQPSINNLITEYLKILAPAPIFAMVFLAFERLCEGLNKAKYAMYAIIICNLLNIFLNYVFLTGSFNMPNLGVKGTATATLAVSILEMILIIIFATRDKLVKLSLRFRREYFSLNDVKKVAILGIPGGIFAFSESAAFSVAGFFASSISVYDIAAHQMLVWIVNSLLVPIFGFSVAVTARIAYNYADGKKALAFKVGVYALILTAIYAFTMLILLVIFDAQIMSALLKGEKGDIVTINLILSAIIILLFSEIFDGVQIMGGAVLRGYQDTIFPLIFAIISYWFICIPLSYYFGIIKEMGVFGIWLGLGIGVTFQAFLISTRFILKFKP